MDSVVLTVHLNNSYHSLKLDTKKNKQKTLLQNDKQWFLWEKKNENKMLNVFMEVHTLLGQVAGVEHKLVPSE